MDQVDFFKKLAKKVDGMKDTAIIASEIDDTFGWIDTGSYVLNAQLSATIHGGMGKRKVLALAGQSGVGKTFYAIGLVKSFLDHDPTAFVVYNDTEDAITKEILEMRGIDTSRVQMVYPDKLEDFRNEMAQFLDKYEEEGGADKYSLLIVLDSLSQLPSEKETTDASLGKNVRDMTRAQIVKSVFRVLQMKLKKTESTMIITNHTYTNVGKMYATEEVAGGGGIKFASHVIALLTKRQEKIDGEIIGNQVDVKLLKARNSKEKTKVTTLLTYSGGLDRYYGLLSIAEEAGIFVKVTGGKYEVPTHEKPQFGKTINNNPEKYYTDEVLAGIDEYCKKKFQYGMDGVGIEVEDENDEESNQPHQPHPARLLMESDHGKIFKGEQI